MENLSSDEEDEKQPSKSAPLKNSSIGCSLRELAGRLKLNLGHLRLRDRLTLNLGDLRDRLVHANPITNPVTRWMAYAVLVCWMESLNLKHFTTSVYRISEMCYAMRKEQPFECTSQFECMRMVIWHSSSLIFYLGLDLLGFIHAPSLLREVTERLRNYGFTYLKTVKTYLIAVNLFWLFSMVVLDRCPGSVYL